jgi:NodT family efflux transporter outer membrane factor (OMF) lipoprotein
LLLLACAAGCAGPRPDAPKASAVTPPASWRTGQPGLGEISAGWWQGFGDPVLTRIVETALANNDDMAIAAGRVEEARGQFRLARGALLPSLALGGGGGRERVVSPFLTGVYQTDAQVELSLSYDTDLFGRLRSTTKAARAALLATEAARDNVLLAVASSAASGYIVLRSLDARLVILKDTLAARADSFKIAQRQAQAGYATRLVQEQAEAEYRATEEQIPAIQLAIAHLEDGLSVLLGDNPRAIERGVAFNALANPPVPSALPSALLRRRPDIVQAEYQIVAADRSLDAARAAFMPDIQLTTTGGYVASTLLGDPIAIFSLGGSVLAPIYEGGRLSAGADIAAARRDQAAFAYRKAALNAFREVEDALASLQRTSEEARALRQERDALARALAQARKRYRAGYSSYIEQLDAQRGLLSAELALVQARSDQLTAAVSLYQAVGGGWDADTKNIADAK